MLGSMDMQVQAKPEALHPDGAGIAEAVSNLTWTGAGNRIPVLCT